MPQSLNRYCTYSFLLHVAVIAWIGIATLAPRPAKQYYAVDFIGAPSGEIVKSAPQTPAPETVKPVEEPKTVVNPKEDLLIKKKTKKKVKEVVSEVPEVPSVPQPKLLKGKAKEEDTSVIPSAPAGSGVGIGVEGGGGTAGDFPYTWYVHTIRQKLDGNWNVSSGFDKRIYTQVAFTIRKDGSIADPEIEEGSGNDVFDRAALRAVEYTNPLPPLPSGYTESQLRVHVRFTVKR